MDKKWKFLHVMRKVFQGSNNWGYLFIVDENDKWEKLCYTYELPWIEDKKGRSKKGRSRINIGEYELKTRSDGKRGWRLQLKDTGHRTFIQVHRAHKSMYIEGCILPVHFSDLESAGLSKGDKEIQNKSKNLMETIRKRYKLLKKKKEGNPTIEFSAILPPKLETKFMESAIA